MESSTENQSKVEIARRAWQAQSLWGIFIVLSVIINGTIPFALGTDLHAWTYSETKALIVGLVIYAGLFLMAPLILIKGRKTVRQRGFLLPLLVAMITIAFWHSIQGIAAISLMAIAYLHWRHDLSDFGIRSRGLKGDVMAILLLGLLSFVPVLLQPGPYSFTPAQAMLAGLHRLFANPASSAENMFYFGFMAERLSHKTGKWLTPLLVGFLYTCHEMTNPEYWYENMPFVLTFLAVAISTAIYLWRRSVVVIWLSSGLGRFISRLF